MGCLLATDKAGHQAANARRLGLMFVTWNRRILGTYRLNDGWRPYECTGVTGCHQNHVHFSFSWAGASGSTSFWTGTVAAPDYGPCRQPGQMFAQPYAGPRALPCPSWTPLTTASPLIGQIRAFHTTTVGLGSRGSAVIAAQQALGGLRPDGSFGPRSSGGGHHLPAAPTSARERHRDAGNVGGAARLCHRRRHPDGTSQGTPNDANCDEATAHSNAPGRQSQRRVRRGRKHLTGKVGS